jgi:uncharacterized membrane protein YeaQ/YmgE (transglycosylase-associated protein family)
VCARGSDRALAGGPSTSPLERSMNRRALWAIATGTVVLWLTEWCLKFALNRIDPTASHGSLILNGMLLNVLITLPSVLPGFCAGWIAKHRGAFVGLLVGLIGGATYSVLFMTLGLNEHHALNRLNLSNALMWFLSEAPGLLILCAVAGAAGELLRSNQRSERPVTRSGDAP